MTWTMEEARESMAEERHGVWGDVKCTVCGEIEAVVFDGRTERPWLPAEPCECGAEARDREALDGWEYE